MNLSSQINNTCKSTFYHIRNLSVIQNILDEENAKVTVCAFVFFTLDYGNSLLYGLSKSKISITAVSSELSSLSGNKSTQI